MFVIARLPSRQNLQRASEINLRNLDSDRSRLNLGIMEDCPQGDSLTGYVVRSVVSSEKSRLAACRQAHYPVA